MRLTREQVEGMKATGCDSRWSPEQKEALCDMALCMLSETKRKLTDEEIQHWAERHDLGPGMTDLRACIGDARSL